MTVYIMGSKDHSYLELYRWVCKRSREGPFFFLSGFLKSRVMHSSIVRFSHLLMKIWYILLFCWKNFLKEQNIIRYTSILFLQWKTTSASICNGFAIVWHLIPQSWWDVLFLAGEKKSKLCFMEGRGFAELSAVFTFFSSGFIIQRRRRRRESFLPFLMLVEQPFQKIFWSEKYYYIVLLGPNSPALKGRTVH